MATQSFLTNNVINDKKTANSLLRALEKTTKSQKKSFKRERMVSRVNADGIKKMFGGE